MTTPWYRTWHGLVVIAAYGLLTLGAAVVSTGWPVGSSFFPDPASVSTGQVPGYVYVYAFLGGMAYAFTSVVAKFERGTPGVLRVGIRAMASLPLAAGVFLLSDALRIDASGGQFVAGLAFLVGLYVNVTLKALGGVADRLFGRTAAGDSPTDSSGEPPTGVSTEASGESSR